MSAGITPGALVDVRDLRVYFPIFGGLFQRKVGVVKAVDGVSISLFKGETVGLVGESGCGKTTVGRAIINVLRHMAHDVELSGSIFYNFTPPPVDILPLHHRSMGSYRAKVQMIFQDPYSSLNPRMTVQQILAEPLQLHTDKKGTELRDYVAWLMKRVGLLPDQISRFPHEFSGGQRQRIGIARSLATNPELIICDEPVSALDVSIQAQVINLMGELQEEFGLTYLFIAHDLSVVEHISDKIAVMYLGNIVEFGTSEQVYFDPKHPYSKALLSAVPVANPRRERARRIVLKGDVPTPINKPSGCGFRTRCPIAKPDCAKDVPPLRNVGEEHLVACPYA